MNSREEGRVHISFQDIEALPEHELPEDSLGFTEALERIDDLIAVFRSTPGSHPKRAELARQIVQMQELLPFYTPWSFGVDAYLQHR